MSTSSISISAPKRASAQRTKAPVLQLVPRFSNRDTEHAAETAQALRQMAEMAERGEIIGLAYVALHPHRKASVGTFGVADNDPPLVSYWLQRLNRILLQDEV